MFKAFPLNLASIQKLPIDPWRLMTISIHIYTHGNPTTATDLTHVVYITVFLYCLKWINRRALKGTDHRWSSAPKTLLRLWDAPGHVHCLSDHAPWPPDTITQWSPLTTKQRRQRRRQVAVVVARPTTTTPDCLDFITSLQLGTDEPRAALLHRSRIRYLSKKNSRILTNFQKLKKFVKIRTQIR